MSGHKDVACKMIEAEVFKKENPKMTLFACNEILGKIGKFSIVFVFPYPQVVDCQLSGTHNFPIHLYVHLYIDSFFISQKTILEIL